MNATLNRSVVAIASLAFWLSCLTARADFLGSTREEIHQALGAPFGLAPIYGNAESSDQFDRDHVRWEVGYIGDRAVYVFHEKTGGGITRLSELEIQRFLFNCKSGGTWTDVTPPLGEDDRVPEVIDRSYAHNEREGNATRMTGHFVQELRRQHSIIGFTNEWHGNPEEPGRANSFLPAEFRSQRPAQDGAMEALADFEELTEPVTLNVIGYNVESGGARISTLREIVGEIDGCDIWGFSEVRSRDWAMQLEQGAEEGENADFQTVLGSTGGSDRLAVVFDAERFELVGSDELDEINIENRVRAPLVAHLRERSSGGEFLFMINHLYRSRATARHRQSMLLNSWMNLQSLPVIAVGDYNYDWGVDDGDVDHDEGYDFLTAGGTFEWVRPEELIKTQDSGFNSVLDFVFAGGDAREWTATSTILVRDGDFPDNHLTSDHRPVRAHFEISAADPAPAERGAIEILNVGGEHAAVGGVAMEALIDPGVADHEDDHEEHWHLPCLQAFPSDIQSNIEARDRAISGAFPFLGVQGAAGFESVIQQTKAWTPGQTISVAFEGGSYELRRGIMNAAREWLNPQTGASLVLDFGHDPNNRTFREWTRSDTSYRANIRISFRETGFWSLVGSDCSNPVIVSPSRPSMSLAGFHVNPPANWQDTVMHEFGHALGVLHEHQFPELGCEDEFRWNDDAGYIPTVNGNGTFVADSQGRRPGLYTFLSGPPNNWEAAKVDHNLRQLPVSSAFVTSENFDPDSRMLYRFGSWMFVDGENSRCFLDTPTSGLSDADLAGIRSMYPPSNQRRQLEKISESQSELLRGLIKTGRLGDRNVQPLRMQLESLTQQKK